jgi:hypothetical protein
MPSSEDPTNSDERTDPKPPEEPRKDFRLDDDAKSILAELQGLTALATA